jgi:hypothetical protein
MCQIHQYGSRQRPVVDDPIRNNDGLLGSYLKLSLQESVEAHPVVSRRG